MLIRYETLTKIYSEMLIQKRTTENITSFDSNRHRMGRSGQINHKQEVVAVSAAICAQGPFLLALRGIKNSTPFTAPTIFNNRNFASQFTPIWLKLIRNDKI